MADDLKAVALTAPEPAGWRRMSAADWERFGKHAGLPAIEHLLRQAKRDQRAAQRAVDRLQALAAERAAQITAGEWPPKVERVTWGELQAGDVLLDDPGRETLVEDVKTEHGWTTVHYRINDSLYFRSAPAGREITIKPRIEEASS